MKHIIKLLNGKISVENLEKFCITAMNKSGMKKKDSQITAKVLVTTDTWGIYSHGTKQLYNYIKKIKAGGINPRATPEIVHEGLGWAVIDGQAAMAMVTSCYAMGVAIKKAKEVGVGYAGVKNSTHFGAAGYYTNIAARKGMIGLAMSNVDINMTIPGAKGSVIGNNPFSYAVPTRKEKPIFLDIAMSTVAAGKIYTAQSHCKKIPNNWLVDENGNPTIDISKYPNVGSLVPMGAHKGYGLAILVEVLAAVLTGAAITKDVKSWLLDIDKFTNEGHAFFALDVGKIMPINEFKNRMDRMIQQVKSSPKSKESNCICLPGEREWEMHEKALLYGMDLPEDVKNNLKNLALELDIDIL